MKDKIIELAGYLGCNGPELYHELCSMGVIIPDEARLTRFEVIDHSGIGEGREFVRYYQGPVVVENSLQDDNRTLKIFITNKESGQS